MDSTQSLSYQKGCGRCVQFFWLSNVGRQSWCTASVTPRTSPAKNHNQEYPKLPVQCESIACTFVITSCFEMVAHFSPCGRFLAACVACIPQTIDREGGLEGEGGVVGRGAWPHPAPSRSGSPTHHITAAQQLICELRVHFLEDTSQGRL